MSCDDIIGDWSFDLRLTRRYGDADSRPHVVYKHIIVVDLPGQVAHEWSAIIFLRAQRTPCLETVRVNGPASALPRFISRRIYSACD